MNLQKVLRNGLNWQKEIFLLSARYFFPKLLYFVDKLTTQFCFGKYCNVSVLHTIFFEIFVSLENSHKLSSKDNLLLLAKKITVIIFLRKAFLTKIKLIKEIFNS